MSLLSIFVGAASRIVATKAVHFETSSLSFCIWWLLCSFSWGACLVWLNLVEVQGYHCLENFLVLLFRCRNFFICSGEASYSFLFLRSFWLLIGNFPKKIIWMNLAAKSCNGWWARTFRRCSKKSEKVFIVRSYIAWPHLHLAPLLKYFLVNPFLNFDSTLVIIVSVDKMRTVNIANSKIICCFDSSVSPLLNGRSWLRRRCSTLLDRSFFHRDKGTFVYVSLCFAYVA